MLVENSESQKYSLASLMLASLDNRRFLLSDFANPYSMTTISRVTTVRGGGKFWVLAVGGGELGDGGGEGGVECWFLAVGGGELEDGGGVGGVETRVGDVE
ncbi:hypothetical protein KSS87_009720 [Heliosperma pusillum]|nr:hypothetical protein KSS87_009720 [Heliosperma pusillum]